MELPSLDRDSLRSPYAEQLKKGFAALRFTSLIEKEFRDTYVMQSLRRGRLSGLIALILVLAVGGIDLVFGMRNRQGELDVLWLFVLVPVLLAMVVSMYLPGAQRWYTAAASIGVTVVGLVVTYMCQIAALGGESYLLAGQELVILYACLFLGLLFRVATTVGCLLVAAHLSIGLVLGLPAEELLYMTAILGASAVIASISTYKLEHSLRTNFLETRLLNEAAERDGMTNLYNRRIFDDYVGRLWRQSHREGETLEIIFVDIDYFKIYNDLYGHQAGDDCLKKVAQTIARCAKRPLDFSARYGGEEFVLVLYGPPEDYGRNLPEQIRRDVMALAIRHEGSRAANVVTVSVGVALDLPRSSRSLTGAIQLADEALYQAKQEGRNRVVFKTSEDAGGETGKFRTLSWEPA
ncbi:MAG TPA: diguanylate cyclase [Gammaproteobacteria bacterium]|nr:diguanylate cyclase [Gammaproteobacteria bacterium]